MRASGAKGAAPAWHRPNRFRSSPMWTCGPCRSPCAPSPARRAYIEELRDSVAAVKAVNEPAFGATAGRLAAATDSLARATDWMLATLAASPDAALAGATAYLRLFASAAGGCMLADEALA